MTLQRVFIAILFFTCISFNLFAQCPGSPPLAFTFESTESRCESNGTITMHITGGTPFTDPSGNPIYNNTIIAPIVTPIGGQADSVFAALAAGTYTVEVADANGCKVTHSVTVPGTHMQLELTPTWGDATCDGLGGGWICGTPDEGRPWPPGYYQYQLFDGSTNPPTPLGPISLDSCFTDLAEGSYQIRAYDSCQNFQTRDVILGKKTYSSSPFVAEYVNWKLCDTTCIIFYAVNTTTFFGEFPYSWEIYESTEPSLVGQTGTFDAPNERDTFCISGLENGNFRMRVTDECGYVGSTTESWSGPRLFSNFGFDCTGGEGAHITLTHNLTNHTTCPAGVNPIWEMISFPPGDTIRPPQDSNYFPNLEDGTYCFQVTDCCGFISSTCRTTVVPSWTQRISSQYTTCDSTVVRFFASYRQYGAAPQGYVSVLTSAPTGYTGIVPDTAHSTITGPRGVYCFEAYDDCGNMADTCYTIDPPPFEYDLDIDITPGCVTGNQLDISLTRSGGSVYYQLFALNPYNYMGIHFSSNSFNNLSTGDYRIRVYNSTGACELLLDTITIPEYVPPAITGAWGIECTNGAGLISVAGSGGNTPYTYELFQGPVTRPLQSTPNFPGLPAGTYDVRLNDNCNNSAVTTVSIEPFMPILKGYGGSFCAGDSAAIYVDYIELATYSWTGPNGNMSDTSILTFPNISIADAGTYTVNIDVANPDQTACVAQTLTVEIEVFDCSCTVGAFSASMVDCNAAMNGTATANINSATGGPFTYVWSNGGNTQMISNLGPGSYAVTITDAGGCSVTGDTLITQPMALTLTGTSTNIDCNGSNNGSIDITPSGGTTAGTSCTDYSYNWSNMGVTQDLSNLGPGTYSVTVTDCNGCTVVQSYTISEPAALTLSGIATNITCNGANNGSINITPGGGTTATGQICADYAYNWSNMDVTQDLNNLGPGTYTVTVTDCNGCSIIRSYMISQPAAISCTVTGTNANCAGIGDGTATSSVQGGTMPYSYLWNTGAMTANLNGLSAGTYTVTVTDANNCSTVCSTTIMQPSTGIVSIASSIINVACYGEASGSATYQTSGGTPPYSLDWSNGQQDTNIPTNGQATLANLAVGTYFVTITDANGCTLIKSFTITQNPDLIAAVLNVTEPTCHGESTGLATYNPSGGVAPYYYNWDSGETTQTASGLSAGFNYTTVTDAVGCSKTYSLFLFQPPLLTCMIDMTPVTCNGDSDGTATATVTGGTLNPGNTNYQYLWSTGETTPGISNLTAGTYMLTVMDDNGCTSTCSVVVIEPDELIVTLSGTDLLCNADNSGTIDMTVTGGNNCGISNPGSFFGNQDTYLWSNGATTEDLSGLAAGTYTVTVTDCKGCVATGSYTLLEPPLLTAAALGTNLLCNGDNTGSIELTVTGGTPAYSYNWSNGMTSEDPMGLAAGTYMVTVTDDNGCTATTSVTLTEPPVLMATASGTDLLCFEDSSGSINLTVTGGTTAYSYVWSNGMTTEDPMSLTAGTYMVTVTDMNGCLAMTSVTLTEPPLLTVTASSTEVTCYGGSDGTANATVTGGTPAYTYDWSNGASTKSITGLSAGTYTLTVTDANECTATTSVIVIEPPVYSCDMTVVADVTCYGYMDGIAMAGATGGTPGYTYQWGPGAHNQSTQTATGLAAGTFSVTVTDSRGCPLVCSVTVNQPPKLEATVAITDVSCFSDSDGSATVTATGGVPGYLYQWDSGETSATATGLSPGTYSVSVTDLNGCCYITSAVVGATVCDPCQQAEDGVLDICAEIDADPNHPLATLDCDNGGIINSIECAEGTNPLDPNDDCAAVTSGNIDICTILTADPSNPLGAEDCDNGGVTNADECNAQTNPTDPADDCDAAINEGIDICAIVLNDPMGTMANEDCDDGGISNINECNNGGDPTDPADDCEVAADMNMDICALLDPDGDGTFDPSIPWATLDCDNGGVTNIDECIAGTDPSDPSDDPTCACHDAEVGTIDICAILAADPSNPLSTMDCDEGGIDNLTECNAGGDPLDPADDCMIADQANVDICAMITADPSHPLANVDCDNGGVLNIDECANGDDPFEPSDDCQSALDLGLNICALINFDPTHPLASLDCDGGGVMNITECNTGEDPSDPADDCESAAAADLDICAMILSGQTGWATLDCDHGGVNNGVECANGGNPSDPQDDLACPSDPCEEAAANNVDVCAILTADPTNPIGTLDCDHGGIDNQTECDNGGDPTDPADDCTIAVMPGVDICAILTNDPSNPLGTLDCDNGGVDNQTECANSGNPTIPDDDCQIAVDAGLNLCALINYDPNHPLAQLDCDGGGVRNIIECNTGEDPTDSGDDCEAAVEADMDICLIISVGGHPWATMDCDRGGVDNATECASGGNPNDPIDDQTCNLDACLEAASNNTDICAVILANPNSPLATLDCDDGGIDNQTECNNGGDPNDPDDDCTIAGAPGVDICAILSADPTNPLGDLDCDDGGISNQDECDNGGDPFDPSDDCQVAVDGNINICLIIFGDPNHPLASQDCDNGGIDNYTECASGEDPTDPADDCNTVIDEDIEICSIILGANGNHPLATLDCDNGGVDNTHECQHMTDTNDPSDDCIAAIRCNLDICDLIGGDPNHPLADKDCDDGGMDNWSECQSGGDPNNPADDCIAAVADTANICLIIYNNPDHPMASTDCDNGGVPNWYECQNGEDPLDPTDDCNTAIDVGADVCTIIITHPTSPIATLDCDGGGIDNGTECANGGDPADPADDCLVAIATGEDICTIIGTNPNHPMASIDCDNGGIDNGTECANGGNPADPADDCTVAKAAGVNVCALIAYDATHPLATLDCDNGGVDNYTECVDAANDPCDPADDCESAVDAGMDICAILSANPGHPWASMDCDNGGIDNETECASGGDPSDPIDDGACPPDLCEEAYNGNIDICAELSANPNDPMGTMDCDNGGIDNQTECNNGGNPIDPDDDCLMAINAGLNLCAMINGDPTHPMASLDCDGGGIMNITECLNGEDPTEPSDDCMAAIDAEVNICQIINYEPTHPMATQDCDNGGIDNWTECQNGGDPSDPIDDCDVVLTEQVDLCVFLSNDPNNPIGNADCDEDGVTNGTECADGTDPLDPCDFNPISITLPVTADQTPCGLCPDLTPITTILPGNIAGISSVCVSVEVSELNGFTTDSSAIRVTMPSDPRFTFTWDPTLTTCGLLTFNNPDWSYAGNNGIVHTFEYIAPSQVIVGSGSSAFGYAATYDPQSTDGQTTITATIRPFSGGECNILNNTDSERLVYFE